MVATRRTPTNPLAEALARCGCRSGSCSARWRCSRASQRGRSLMLGAAVAFVGEAIRIWAAGHLEKGREVTMSGPYRLTRHPLYLGSALIGIGLAIASANWWVAALVLSYLAVTLTAAIRTEEAHLTEKFGAAYPDYRDGRAAPARNAGSASSARFGTANIVRRAECCVVLAVLYVRRSYGGARPAAFARFDSINARARHAGSSVGRAGLGGTGSNL